MAKAYAQLEEWEKKYKEDTNAKSKAERKALVKEHSQKLKLKRDSFVQKKSELKAENAHLAKELKDTEAMRQQALTAKTDAEEELASLQM